MPDQPQITLDQDRPKWPAQVRCEQVFGSVAAPPRRPKPPTPMM